MIAAYVDQSHDEDHQHCRADKLIEERVVFLHAVRRHGEEDVGRAVRSCYLANGTVKLIHHGVVQVVHDQRAEERSDHLSDDVDETLHGFQLANG